MKLVLIGGGKIPNWNFDTLDVNETLYETEKIDKKIVDLSQKKNPKLLFIGTAKKDNIIYYNAINRIYTKLGCTVAMLDTMKIKENEHVEKDMLSADIIYIGGGNTRFMLKRWDEIGLNEILKKAIRKDIVVAGFSAGAYAMCKYTYDLIEGMNILNLMLMVHYNEKSEEKRKMFYDNIISKNILGIALENSTALVIENEKYEIIKENDAVKGFKCYNKDGKITKEEI